MPMSQVGQGPQLEVADHLAASWRGIGLRDQSRKRAERLALAAEVAKLVADEETVDGPAPELQWPGSAATVSPTFMGRAPISMQTGKKPARCPRIGTAR